MKHFYTNIIEFQSLFIELEKLDLSAEEKLHLAKLADSTLHTSILEAILSQLTQPEKEIFIKHLKDDDHTKTWEFLNLKIENAEDKIKKVADDIKKQLHTDIEEAKEIK